MFNSAGEIIYGIKFSDEDRKDHFNEWATKNYLQVKSEIDTEAFKEQKGNLLWISKQIKTLNLSKPF